MNKPTGSEKIDIKRISQLASLPLSAEEENKLANELNQTLDYIATLNTIDTTNIPETSQVTGLVNILREDTPLPSLSQDEALSNTKETYNGFFKVKAILPND